VVKSEMIEDLLVLVAYEDDRGRSRASKATVNQDTTSLLKLEVTIDQDAASLIDLKEEPGHCCQNGKALHNLCGDQEIFVLRSEDAFLGAAARETH